MSLLSVTDISGDAAIATFDKLVIQEAPFVFPSG